MDNNGVVKLDQFMVGVLQSLVNEREVHRRGFEDTQAKIMAYVKQCAGSKGISDTAYDKNYRFDDKVMGFVKKFEVKDEVEDVKGATKLKAVE